MLQWAFSWGINFDNCSYKGCSPAWGHSPCWAADVRAIVSLNALTSLTWDSHPHTQPCSSAQEINLKPNSEHFVLVYACFALLGLAYKLFSPPLTFALPYYYELVWWPGSLMMLFLSLPSFSDSGVVVKSLTGEAPALLVLGSLWLLVSCPFKEQQVFAIDGEVRDYLASVLFPKLKAVDLHPQSVCWWRSWGIARDREEDCSLLQTVRFFFFCFAHFTTVF